jgi:hypothetical protein
MSDQLWRIGRAVPAATDGALAAFVMAAVVTVLVVAAIAFGMSLSSISHTSGPQTTHTQ